MTYRDWNRSYARPFRRPAYDEAEARRRWDAEETFFVLFGDPDHPNPVLEVSLGGDHIHVCWLDELNRPVLGYLFVPEDDLPEGVLVLEQTQVNEYWTDTPLPQVRSEVAEAWFFNTDGKFYAVRTDPGTPRLETRGVLDAEQLALQMEPKPAFGDWASITRRER